MATSELFTVDRLRTLLKRDDVTACVPDEIDIEKISKVSSMRWVTVKFSKSDELRVVLKTTAPGDAKAKTYGTAREALFYANWRRLAEASQSADVAAVPLLESFVPTVHFATGNMETGEKCILMEDLSACVQAGYWFGGLNPNNWGKDLAAERAKIGCGVAQTPEAVTDLCFTTAAKLHAAFWDCRQLVGSSEFAWLRGSEWLAGAGRESWEASIGSVRDNWAECKKKFGDEGMQWDPLMVELLDSSLEKAGWEAYQAEVKQRPLTLTHGDFHPANFMLCPAGSTSPLVLIDWEVVGLGSGPQDLGQFMISHVDPELRTRIEEPSVRRYYEELVKLKPQVKETMSFEQCWNEYVFGGLGRWMWFVPLLARWCPPEMAQTFHDQVVSFARTHRVTGANAPMPRA